MTLVEARGVPVVEGSRAGLASRGLAGVIDLIVILGIVAGLYLAVAGMSFAIDPRGFRFPRPAPGTTSLVGFLVAVGYLGGGWLLTGRTIGNQVAGLRVVSAKGTRLGPLQALARALACIIFPVGLLWVAFSRSNSSLQDLVFRTAVIYDWRRRLLVDQT